MTPRLSSMLLIVVATGCASTSSGGDVEAVDDSALDTRPVVVACPGAEVRRQRDPTQIQVNVRMLVDATGNVARATSPTAPGIRSGGADARQRAAELDAVSIARNCTFRPATAGGQVVAAWRSLTLWVTVS